MWSRRYSHINRLATLVAFLKLAEACAGGTSIVILNNSQEIVVAADSKMYGLEGGTCKIFQIGPMYWAMSGKANAKGAYNIPAIVERSYSQGHGIAGTLQQFKKNSAGPLEEYMEYLRRHSPKMFELARNNPLQMAFWGFEGGKPVVAYVYYTARVIDNRVSIHEVEELTTDCRSVDCAANVQAAMLGVHGSIVAYVQSHPDWAAGGDLLQVARHFVELAIAEAPDTVGKPINIMIVHSDGSHLWAPHSDYCRDPPARH
jgi:hypothetical protein